ncbi:MAG: lysyl-tRNA synthetase, class [Candidatus Methanomethylophilaceae archaeon]|nr:lysyl-tRNA synthetase, class [Candidatus Methanomethylophilaceae archaeon]MDI3542381.1 lysyl-tRNA synthetase, class [Candidatus Methanomethylophilaceae archaeon]HIJ00744.1 lysine--tRNA ligase [Candidatus Methanomethylophilaceae archaeon]
MHWADVIARDLMSTGDKHLISAGISPTGFIHVGSLREAVTAETVRKALADQGADVRMIYLIDSYDPLRRRYDFLPEGYEDEVGKPISHVPCPYGCHDTYADHFIKPFMESMDEIGVNCELFWTHELYERGMFTETIDATFRRRNKVLEILNGVTGREMPDGFYPFSPLCKRCGRLNGTHITAYEYPYVHYVCDCGESGKADIRKGEGKLSWRLEWPAKWKIFGVTCEPFGKDHAAAGGSYDSGVRLVREVFDAEPPYPIPYEFIQLKGKGQMHKSTGSSVSGIDALKMMPSTVFTYTIIRVNPERHIDYDSGLGILDMVDEYDRVERLYYEGGATEKEEDLLRAYELSQPNGPRPTMSIQIPYRHLVNVVQISRDFDDILTILRRTTDFQGVDIDDLKTLEKRVECVRYWLNAFAPESVKFKISETLPDVEISPEESVFLKELLQVLEGCEWTGDAVHNAVYETAKASSLGAKKAFQTLYLIFIERRSGPRLGHFLATLERDFVLRRIAEAAEKAA